MDVLTHRRPSLPDTHYVDNRIYTDQGLFNEEQQQIFAKTWKFVCHVSELPKPGDFRTVTVAGLPLVVVRDEGGQLRTVVNVCAHRGATVVREERGNCKAFQCFYHHWVYGLDGRLKVATRPEGYAGTGFSKEDFGLRQVRTESAWGLVFVCLDDTVGPLTQYLADLTPYLKDPLGGANLEVFHYHRAELKTNWKLWNDNSNELYHEFLHYLNRKTAVAFAGNYDRSFHLFPNGMSVIDPVVVRYDALGLPNRKEHAFPGMMPGGLMFANIFPELFVMFRATVLRMDSLTPLSPGRTLVEFRGLGLKDDSPEVRRMRIKHHNQVWGPMGRNLPEDIEAAESQWENMQKGGLRYSVIAREENLKPQDDGNIRAFYQEWGRRLARRPNAPFGTDHDF